MTRRPFTSGELGRDDAELDQLGAELEALAAGASTPSRGFHNRVLAAVDGTEPPRRWWLAAWLAPGSGAAWQGATLALVLVLGVTAALMAGGLLDGVRRTPGAGTSPAPSESAEQSITPSPSPSPSPTITPTPSSAASVSPTATPVVSAEGSPSESEDGAETPRPGESDNSGPGGGGGDSSGSGSGDD
ncbi:MAG: hypothetical protein ABI622_05935 [Chloroflexota bacterium]